MPNWAAGGNVGWRTTGETVWLEHVREGGYDVLHSAEVDRSRAHSYITVINLFTARP